MEGTQTRGKNKGTLRQCAICGVDFEPKCKGQQCCGRVCSSKKSAQTHRIVKSAECTFCGKQFVPKDSRFIIFCSRECYFASYKAQPKAITQVPCVICGKPFDVRGKKQTCSPECRQQFSKDTYNIRVRFTRGYCIPATKDCKQCGQTFTADTHASLRIYCSHKCSRIAFEETANGKDIKYRSKSAYKARLVGATVGFVKRSEVFIRDKWRCGICGGKINRRMTVPHPDAPTLDHIIPLAKGGQHSMANLQAAHFICNATKSDGSGGQLRLDI